MIQKPAPRWKKLILVALGLIVGIVAITGYSIYRTVNVTIPHSYAAWTVGDLLVEYMDTHEGKWPKGWTDLREAKESMLSKGRIIYWDFERLPEIVKIDWDVQPEKLAKAVLAGGESEVKVVTQLDGSKLEASWGEDTEPNRKVAQYLRGKLRTQ